MSWNWPNWEQLRALAYSVNSYHLWAITAHTKLSVSLTIKICWFFWWFLNMSTFADLPRNEFLKFVHRISFLVIGNNMELVLNMILHLFWCTAKNKIMGEGQNETFRHCVCYKDRFARWRYVQIWAQKLPKFSLINFFEILTSQKKSQLISAVWLHFLIQNVNSKRVILQSEKCITGWKKLLFVYIFVLLQNLLSNNSADLCSETKM